MDLESCVVNLACFLGRGDYRLVERDGIQSIWDCPGCIFGELTSGANVLVLGVSEA